MKHRNLLLVAGGLTTAMAVAAACGFPDPQIVFETAEAGHTPEAGGDADEPPLTDAAVDVFAIDGNQNVDPDGAAQEASTRPDGSDVRDAQGCVDQCDCDEDKVRSNNPACGDAGRDCQDLDPFIPHDGFVATKPNGYPHGDWDCNGTVTKQYPVNVNCGLLGCAGGGFKTDPGCGDEADYVTCKSVAPLGCQETAEKRIQGCR